LYITDLNNSYTYINTLSHGCYRGDVNTIRNLTESTKHYIDFLDDVKLCLDDMSNQIEGVY